MRAPLGRFVKTRRGAIAMIFALSLVPLILLIGLTVDYSFYVQARAQAEMAADAATTHAVRAANETYTYETAINGTSTAAEAAAATEAEAAGKAIGGDWFDATLGVMPRASITGPPDINVVPNANGSAGFTATISFAGTYPPFFAYLFDHRPWNINGSAAASSAYNYVEILMLLDNSPSMLIGATPTDIQTLETISVCPPTSIDPSFEGNTWNWFYQDVPNVQNASGGYGDVPEGSPVTAANLILNYTPGSYQTKNYGESYDGEGYNPGHCASGWTGPGNSSPYAPCAFACHTTTNTMSFTGTNSTTYPFIDGTYPADYYGLARAYSMPNGTTAPTTITLRLDVLQSAASQVIKAMETNEAAADQFSVGVYEFNSDVTPIFPTSTNGLQPEASTDLPDAASAIADAPIPLESDPSKGYTNFPTSVADLISGKEVTSGTTFGYQGSTTGLTAAGSGATATAPQKDIFIVTDGLEDTPYPSTSDSFRREGEMTGFGAESATNDETGSTPWVCKSLKNLGFTVYVLYIDYEPLSNTFYQKTNKASDVYINADYPALSDGTTKDYAEATATSEASPPSATVKTLPPDEAGLYACASSPSDIFEASSASDIATALNAMLASALTSTIQLTH
jgi:hypothetical protein